MPFRVFGAEYFCTLCISRKVLLEDSSPAFYQHFRGKIVLFTQKRITILFIRKFHIISMYYKWYSPIDCSYSGLFCVLSEFLLIFLYGRGGEFWQCICTQSQELKLEFWVFYTMTWRKPKLWFGIYYCILFWNYLIIYLYVQLCDIFSHIDFESDLNYLFGSFNILKEI